MAFPLGLKSRAGANTSISVPAPCPPRAPCPAAPPKTLASLHVSLKKSSRLLVLGQTGVDEDASPKHGHTTLDIGVRCDCGGGGEQYALSTKLTTVTFSQVLSARPGRYEIRLVADARSGFGHARRAHFYDPQITVIALPPLR